MTTEVLDIIATPIGFVESILGLPLYPWQDKALAPLENTKGRVKIAVVTPNGAGKSERIVAGAALYWISVHPRGKVVITTKDGRQLSEQIYPALTKHRDKFQGWQWITSPHIKITTPTGGTISAFTTDDPGRAEGWHKEDDINGPLLIIVDEAKSVPEQIFQALDRCTYNAIIYTSSPGAKLGRFWDAFTKSAADFVTVKAGLKDCPHVPREKVEDVIRTYGPDHPFTKSTNDGEFMDQEDSESFVINAAALDASIANPPKFRPGIRVGFCDFGGGVSEHTFGIRDGNRLTIQDAWIEANPEAAAGRFIRNFRESGLKQEDIWGDASDKNLAELLSALGWTINRQNFGAPSKTDQYKSWGAEAWWETGIAILKNEFIIPDDKKLISQLTTRKKIITPTGKLGVEEKHDLAKRNLPSPDRGDTICGLVRIAGNALPTKQPFSIPGDWMDQVERNERYEVVEELGAFAGV